MAFPESKSKVKKWYHPTPNSYAHMATRGLGLLGYAFYPMYYHQWLTGGQIFHWTSKDKFGKCFVSRGLIRGDGKVISGPDGKSETQCLPYSHYANINHSGYLDGVTSDGFKFTSCPIASVTSDHLSV